MQQKKKRKRKQKQGLQIRRRKIPENRAEKTVPTAHHLISLFPSPIPICIHLHLQLQRNTTPVGGRQLNNNKINRRQSLQPCNSINVSFTALVNPDMSVLNAPLLVPTPHHLLLPPLPPSLSLLFSQINPLPRSSSLSLIFTPPSLAHPSSQSSFTAV